MDLIVCVAGGIYLIDQRQDLRSTKEAVSKYWFSRTQVAPDVHFYYEVTRIKVRSDDSSVLQGTFRVRGTKVVDRTMLATPPSLLVKVKDEESVILDQNAPDAYYYEDKQDIAVIGNSEDENKVPLLVMPFVFGAVFVYLYLF